ncbi:MAG: hypothetical protein QM498_09265 [Desulfobacterium sp.]
MNFTIIGLNNGWIRKLPLATFQHHHILPVMTVGGNCYIQGGSANDSCIVNQNLSAILKGDTINTGIGIGQFRGSEFTPGNTVILGPAL